MLQTFKNTHLGAGLLEKKAITDMNLLFASEIKCIMSALEEMHLPNFQIWIINQTL